MSKEHKYAFPDTNIFLHFQFFTEIDWLEILEAKSVTLVIPPIIPRELDKHKYNHPSERIKDRATKVTKKFVELIRSKNSVRPKVNVDFERIEPQIEFEKYLLSKDSQDDHLIASIIRFQSESGSKGFLVTADSGLILKAHQLNIAVVELPEKYQLKSEENPDKKKIQRLEAENTKLKNKIPDLSLVFSNKEQVIECQMMSEKILTNEEIEAEIFEIQKKYPTINIPSSPKNSLAANAGILFKSEPEFEIVLSSGKKRMIYPSQAKEYNKKLEEYYSECKKHLIENSRVDEIRVRTLVCEVNLSNEGSCPADDVDAFLFFPAFVKVVRMDDRFSYNKTPDVPEIPKLSDKFQFKPHFPSFIDRDFLRNLPSNQIAKWDPKIIQKDEGDEVNLWTKNLKHGHSNEFERFCVIFSDVATIKSFQIAYKITASNLPKHIEGKLNIKIKKQSHG